MSAAVVAFGAVSAMGEGAAAVSAGSVGEPARTCIARDEELAGAGLARPYAARVALPPGSGDRASTILLAAALGCVRELDRAMPGWRDLRVGLVVGTSSGAMRTAEAFFVSRVDGADLDPASCPLAARAVYFAPLLDAVRALGKDFEPATLVMGACAASTLAIGIGLRWLAQGSCDLVLAGGFDAVSTFVAAGFEVLRATTSAPPPRPFRLGRDGMALGEGAAILALRPGHLAPGARVHVTGFGASSDAVHLTAPDRTGAGLAAAATAALEEAGIRQPDLVSPHGSATPFSDAAEVRALALAIPDAAPEVVVHPFKAQIGHTLGASGALELLAAVDALTCGVDPAAAGEGEVDPDARVNLLGVARAGTPRTALKLSAAFGGANAALVVARDPAPSSGASRPRAPRPRVFLGRPVHVGVLPPAGELAARVGWPVERVQRADAQARWAVAAVAALFARDGALVGKGVGLIVGTPFATLETNTAFFARVRQRGPQMAEPRRFPYTSPNAAAGDAAAAFGLTGPSFAVGSGLHAALEAVVVAADLVRAGDAQTIVVAAVDDVGPTVTAVGAAFGVAPRAGAVALVVSVDPGAAHDARELLSAACGMGPRATGLSSVSGHEALLPLLEPGGLATVLEARSSDVLATGSDARADAWARLELAPYQPPADPHGIDAPHAAP